MSLIPASLSAIASRQHGLVTAPQLAAGGISAYRRRRLLQSRLLVAVHEDVYRFAAVTPTFEQQCLAACLAVGDLAMSGPTAGRLLGLRRMPPGPVHAMVLVRTVQLRGVIVHRTNQLDAASDVVLREDGIRVLSNERLVFDLARFCDDHDFESVLEQMLDRRMVTVPQLFATGRRLRRMGRDGSARFGRVLEQRPAWAKPADSDLEVRLLRALRERGVDLQPQLEVELPNGSVIHLDGGDPERRFGVEVDHVTWHGGRVTGAYDKWRTRQLLRIGWAVPRIPDCEINDDLDGVVCDLVEIYARRAAA